MRLNFTSIILIILFYFCSEPLVAQQTLPILINKTFTNSPLPQVLDAIQGKYKLTIYYQREWINTIKVTANFQSRPVAGALNQLLSGSIYLLFSIIR